MATFTSSTFLGGAGRFDGNGNASWAGERDKAAAAQSFAGYEVEAELSGSTYRVQRTFLPIDTSSIPADATVTAVTLNFNANYEGGYTTTVAHLVQTTQATTSSRDLADFDLVAGIPGGAMTSGGSVAIANGSPATAKTITGNATSLGWITKAGTTKLALVVEKDQTNTAPTGAGDSMWATVTSPELVVTYTLPGGGFPFVLF